MFVFLNTASIGMTAENGVAVVKKVEPAIGYVKTYDQFGKLLSVGSGFFIDKSGFFITNRHVVNNAAMIAIEMSDGRKIGVKRILSSHPDIDLVKLLIDLNGNSVESLNLATEPPQKGEFVFAFGNPYGLKFTVSEGIISGIQQFPEISKRHKYIQFSAPVSSGSSGGALVNSSGEVVGIVVMTKLSGQNLNFAIPVEMINHLIDTEKTIQATKSEQTINEKPKILISMQCDTRISENEKNAKMIVEQIVNKLNPQKNELVYFDTLKLTNFKSFLEDSGVTVRSGEKVTLNDYPKPLLVNFGLKNGYDYILGATAKMAIENPIPNGVDPIRVRVDMDIKFVDVKNDKLLFFDTISETGKHYDFWSGNKWKVAMQDALKKVMISFQNTVPTIN